SFAKLADDPSAPVTPSAAFLFGALGTASSWDSVRRDPRFSDALSPARCFYDEGVSLSAFARARRTALLDACRASLRAIQAGSGPENAAAIVSSRLRCLVNLGGETAATIVRRAIEASPDGGSHTKILFDALAAIDPRQAMSLIVQRGFGAGGRD